MATLFNTDDTMQELKPASQTFELDELKNNIDGWLDALRLTPDSHMYFDEEMLAKGKPFNREATKRLHQCRRDLYHVRLYGVCIEASVKETGDE